LWIKGPTPEEGIHKLKRKIAITGAHGMLGAALCRTFGNCDGWTVSALHRDECPLVSCDSSHKVDLTNADEVRKVIEEISPDVLIHCAAMVNIEACEKDEANAYASNVIATKNVAFACGAQTKFVYISSDQVYQSSLEASDETSRLAPSNVYAKTKLQGERMALSIYPESLIVRTNVFGVSIKPNRISSAEWMLNSLRSRRPVVLFIDYIFSPIYTLSLGRVISVLLETGKSGVFNVGSPRACSKYEFGLAMAKLEGLDASLLIQGSLADLESAANRNPDISMGMDKLVGMGIAPPDYLTSLEKFLKTQRMVRDVWE
jgi:dTDP-4-dehydrorhamnose reductase